MVEGINYIINKDNVSVSTKAQCTHLDVEDDDGLPPLKSCCFGAVKTWVHRPTTHPGLQEVAIKNAEWTVVM